MITAHSLKKSFGDKTVLSDVELELGPGGIHGLLGRNGVGKSTFLSLIAGQTKADGGVLDVFRLNPFDNPRVMDRVALTGVDVAYPSSWTARDIITGGRLRYPEWDDTIADALVSDFGLNDALTTNYGKLSRGQRAMVGIVVGLASGAELTLLDEPYVGLDVHNTDVFYRHLLDLTSSGRTFIMATHHIEDAAKLLDSAIILGRDGSIVAHVHVDEADNYVLATGSFPEPAHALVYEESAAGARAVLPSTSAKSVDGARIQPADFGDIIEALLEAS